MEQRSGRARHHRDNSLYRDPTPGPQPKPTGTKKRQRHSRGNHRTTNGEEDHRYACSADGLSHMSKKPRLRAAANLSAQSTTQIRSSSGSNHYDVDESNTDVLIEHPFDPRKKWQVCCFKRNLTRQELCSYLAFNNTRELRDWECSNSKRLQFLNDWRQGGTFLISTSLSTVSSE